MGTKSHEGQSESLNRPVLNTQRLILRPFREEDLDDYSEICADLDVMRYLADGKAMTRAEAWRHMAMLVGHWELRGFGQWAVEERCSGRVIGRIGFLQPEGWPGFELGWTLGRQHWGKGYAGEGARAALEHGFWQLGRNHIISLIHPDNLPSIKVAARIGETLEGRANVLGRDLLVYGIRRTQAGN